MIRRVLYWVFDLALISSLSYLYNPSVPTMVLAGILALGLSILIAWSAPRLGKGMRAGIVLALTSVVAGFMLSQGLDIGYSLLAAPAGGRFNTLIETGLATLVFLVLGLIARALLPRPKVEE